MDVEWLILADAAQVVGGKVYLIGGGWETLVVNQFPAQQYLAIAASFRVPWNETNQRHSVEIEIQNEDGRSFVRFQGQIEVGRPPGIPLGCDQRAQLAFACVLPFEAPSNFVIVASIEGQEMKRTPFRVVSGAPAIPSRLAGDRDSGKDL